MNRSLVLGQDYLSKFFYFASLSSWFEAFSPKSYGDLRNRCAKIRLRHPNDYYRLTCTGKDLTIKKCYSFAPIKAQYTKAFKEIEHEIKCLEDPYYRKYSETLGKNKRLTWEAIRLRKKRLLDRLKAFTSTSDYCYFFTITAKDGDFASQKENFLYAFENARKHYQKLFGKMHYVGVLERHPKRNKKPFHAHFCAFFDSGYKRYEELWETFGKDVGRIDLRPVETDSIRGLANYSYKAMLDTITAYLNKTEAPESILLASKGSPKPVGKNISEVEFMKIANEGNLETREFVLPNKVRISYMYSDSWSEIQSIFKELQELERQENELLAAEEFTKQQPNKVGGISCLHI